MSLTINGTEQSLDLILDDTTILKADSTLIKGSLFSETRVHPTLAGGVALTPLATAWKLNAAAAVVATSGITTAFQITGINIEEVGTTSGVVEIILYEGTAASSAICSIRAQISTSMGVAAGGVNGLHIPVNTKLIDANKSIKAKCVCDTTQQTAPTISINYKIG